MIKKPLNIKVFRFNRMVYRGPITAYKFSCRSFEKVRFSLKPRKIKHRSIYVFIKKLNSSIKLRRF